MDFQKIKYKDRKTELRWCVRNRETLDETTSELTSTQPPEPAFLLALQALKADVLKLLELPADYGDGMEVTSVSLSYGDDGRMGVVVTSLKSLEEANSPLVLNTPHLPELDIDDQNPCMPGPMQQRVRELVALAKRFAQGKRAQQDLFDTENEPVEAEKPELALV